MMGILTNTGGSATLPCVLLTLGIPFYAIGYYRFYNPYESKSSFALLPSGIFGLTFGVLAIALSAYFFRGLQASLEMKKSGAKIPETDPKKILEELKNNLDQHCCTQNRTSDDRTLQVEEKVEQRMNDPVSDDIVYDSLACLEELIRQCGKAQQRRKKKKADINNNVETSSHELETSSHEASYLVLKNFPNNDAAISSALFLLALIAENSKIRKRHVELGDEFGVKVPIVSMQKALLRAKSDDIAEQEEENAAELQRRGCLFLGALTDGDNDMATYVCQEGGLEAILDAVEWYRYHEDVGNWALWALFILCFDHCGNQGKLVKLNGIQKICSAMKEIPQSLGVQRHGIAILFDLLRDMPGSGRDSIRIRMVAKNSNMHQIVSLAMRNFSHCMDIVMMGRQMLMVTGYTGDIPIYKEKVNDINQS